MTLLKHGLRYLKGTMNNGILHTKPTTAPSTKSFTDAGFAESEDLKSTTGFLQLLFGCPIIWCSKKQSTISFNTYESEHVAASQTLQQSLCRRSILHELQAAQSHQIIPQHIPQTPVYIYNKGAINIANHAGKTRRRKRIDVKFHHLNNHIVKGKITLHHIAGTDNPADIFTNRLPTPLFTLHMDTIIMPPPNNIRPQSQGSNFNRTSVVRSPHSVTPSPNTPYLTSLPLIAVTPVTSSHVHSRRSRLHNDYSST